MEKLKIYVLSLIFFSFLKINAGCCLKVNVTYGKVYPISLISSSPPLIITLNSTDTIYVNVNSCGCMKAIEKILYNDSLLFKLSYLQWFASIPSKPGKYVITASGNPGSTTTATIIIENKLEVGINEYTNANQWLALFPNPSKESVTLNSFEENLKSVAIYNVNSKLIEIIETDANKLTIPLSQYPQGIYIIKVATLSNKIAIKKLIVQ